MNKLNISKVLDVLSMIAIVIVFGLYIFKKADFIVISVALIIIALIKMLASMLKASFYSTLYNDVKQENEIFKEKIAYLEDLTKDIKTESK